MIHTAYRSRWSVGGKYTNKQTENRTMKLLKKVIYGLRKKKNQKAAPIKEIMRFFFQKNVSLHLNPQVLCGQVSLEHKACPNSTQYEG